MIQTQDCLEAVNDSCGGSVRTDAAPTELSNLRRATRRWPVGTVFCLTNARLVGKDLRAWMMPVGAGEDWILDMGINQKSCSSFCSSFMSEVRLLSRVRTLLTVFPGSTRVAVLGKSASLRSQGASKTTSLTSEAWPSVSCTKVRFRT
jgi:hypothetical protein